MHGSENELERIATTKQSLRVESCQRRVLMNEGTLAHVQRERSLPVKKLSASIAIAAAACALLVPRGASAGPHDDAMAQRTLALAESAAALVEADDGNCDKMGEDLGHFIDTKSAEIHAIIAWGTKLSRAERRALMTKYKSRLEPLEGKLRNGLTPCLENAKVVAALRKLGAG
jgi:hypothetical protein